MIQRIQSLYLFIAFLVYIALLFFPVASFQIADSTHYFGSVFSVSGANIIIYPVLVIILAAISILVFVIIFMFKKRLLQIRLTTIALLINVIYIVGLFFFVGRIESQYGTVGIYEPGMYISLVSLVFLLLASRAIRKDENLVRSADRLR